MTNRYTPPTTVTKSGIVIGSAWLPQRTARYADPIDYPERSGESWLWYAIVAACGIACLVLVTGCEPIPARQEAVETQPTGAPDRHGVVCYSRSSYALSCVKVQ